VRRHIAVRDRAILFLHLLVTVARLAVPVAYVPSRLNPLVKQQVFQTCSRIINSPSTSVKSHQAAEPMINSCCSAFCTASGVRRRYEHVKA
jgi:hypothetical protein